MANYKNFTKGIGIVPKSSSENALLGDIEVLLSTFKLAFHNGTTSSPVVTEAHASQSANRLQNKDLETGTTRLVDGSDTTKRVLFVNSGATTGTTTSLAFAQTTSKTITFPDATTTLAGTDATQTLTNKTIDGNNNTIIDIPDAALSSNIVTLAGTQTLTNKTLTSPVLSTPSVDNIFAAGAGSLTLTSTSNILLNANNNVIVGTIALATNTITATSGDLQVQGKINNNLYLNTFGSGYVQLQRNGTTYARVGSSTFELLGQTPTRFYDSGTTNYVGVRAPSSVTSSYTVTLPTAAPGTDTALVYDGTNYVWGSSTTVANGSITLAKLAAAVAASLLPTGTLLPFGGSSAPTGFLLCDGSAVSRTTYAALFAVISTTFGVGDGSTTFNIPNTQGVFIRGAGSQTINSITYSATAGAAQNDATKKNGLSLNDPGHFHQWTSYAIFNSPGGVIGANMSSAGTSQVNSTTTSTTGITINTGDAETRPANLATNYIIKT